MSCDNLGIIGKFASISQPAIVKGSDAFLVAQVVYDGDRNTPYAISNFTGATGFFKQDDGGVLQIPGSLVSSDTGKIRFDVAASGTDTLKAGEEQSFEFAMEDDRGLTFIQYDGKLKINDRLF